MLLTLESSIPEDELWQFMTETDAFVPDATVDEWQQADVEMRTNLELQLATEKKHGTKVVDAALDSSSINTNALVFAIYKELRAELAPGLQISEIPLATLRETKAFSLLTDVLTNEIRDTIFMRLIGLLINRRLLPFAEKQCRGIMGAEPDDQMILAYTTECSKKAYQLLLDANESNE